MTPLLQAQTGQQRAPRIEGIRFWSFGDVTRIAVETSGDYKLYSEQIENPNRVFFDLTGLQPPNKAQDSMQTIGVNDPRLRQIRVAGVSASKTRIVFDLDCPVEVTSSQLVNPDRLMIEIRPKGTSLPALSASKSITAEHKVDLTSHTASVDSDIMEAGGGPKMMIKPMPATLPKQPLVIAASRAVTAEHKVDSTSHLTSGDPDVTDADTSAAIVSKPIPVTLPKQPLVIAASNISVPTGVKMPPAEAPVKNTAAPQANVSAAKMDSSGDRSLVRILGLKMGRVVIDAGHGGHDSGTVGPNGLQEKDLVLDVALRLGSLITKQLGAEVIYTRSTDVFIPLEQRTRIANEQRADLFVSVHANSSPEPEATGVETYYFNLTSDKRGADLATRENATADSSISDLSDMLHRAVLQTKKEESREFAQRVQASLTAGAQKSSSQGRDRGVRQAPFVVLIGATMPSILAEIGFVSNPRDEKHLRRSEERQKIAEALFKGVVQYSNSLSHVQMARGGAE